MQLIKPLLSAAFIQAISFLFLAQPWKDRYTQLVEPEPVILAASKPRRIVSPGPRSTSGAATQQTPTFDSGLEGSVHPNCMLAPHYRTWGDPNGAEGATVANQTRWHCLPTYLGIGFPKCGSSTLWRYYAMLASVNYSHAPQPLPILSFYPQVPSPAPKC